MESATRQVLLSQFSLDQPPTLASRYPAALALSHCRISTSNPRGKILLPEQEDKPMRKEAVARTRLPSTEVLQRAPHGPGMEGGAGLTQQTPTGKGLGI